MSELYKEKELGELAVYEILTVSNLTSSIVKEQSPIAVLYYSSLVGYLALYDLLAITLPAGIM
ncbi:hypothetical protein, partial [Halorubrum sp. Ea1]|uniref:hypothetical protein n=1 Tax=Halorubrum sp. Ea1 TaxID=1480718 RepID=UPI001C3C56FE